MDGSTGDSGVVSFTLDLGLGDYTFSFDISGNQRNGAIEGYSYNLIQDTGVAFGIVGLAGTVIDNSFLTRTANFSVTSAGSFTFSLTTDSNDNVGPILDNILLVRQDVPAVPAPGAFALFGLGLAVLGARRRRG